jgi:hypothetical protein
MANLVQGGDINKPEQYRVLALELYLHNQTDKKVNLLQAYREVGIFENLFESTMSGYVLVVDTLGMIENLNLTGFNYVRIELAKFGEDDPNIITKIFRVYKIGERVSETNNREGYVLYFCSEENVLSEQTKIAKSYPKKMISDVIKSILTDELKTTKIGTIEDTTGQYSFIVPNIKPFEAINWLSIYARSTKYTGADMVFYESSSTGFNFRSIQSIYSDNVYSSYGYSTQNLNQLGFQAGFKSILAYKYIQISDVMQGISDGMYANKLISVDPLLRTSNTTVFNYNDSSASTPSYFSSAKNLNGNPVAIEMKNRLGKTVSQSSDAVVKVLTGNSKETTYQPIQSNQAGLDSIVPSIAVETYIPNRTAQIPLAHSIRVQFTIPGDIGFSVGKIAYLSLPSARINEDKTASVDVYHTGKYLISAVKHQFNSRGEYHCIAEGITDSVSKAYTTPSTDTTVLGS